ncbi:MAG: polysaccharide pyruvyl transferase family protein [Acidovorax soli]|uniref:polysaccharide pyruvyl transferase family protein n=1 Tax=Acidovorax soli TaxID=592050 RepID=UPI0026E99961|nr:polysaccharide pyruvyl transferase family protein [Acidovorax soli]MCM2347600.1 polysaccharide pyruvyl transferase family protein [Acidovorax soli]
MNAHQENGRYVLYGAVANKPLLRASNTKARMKNILDRIAFRLGYKGKLNYKNYEAPYTYNRGDHSIIVATAQQMKKLNPQSNIMTVNWEQLGASDLSSADKVLVCGSGYFFPNPEGILPRRLYQDLQAIEQSDAELHFLGVGYNYLLDWRPSSESRLPKESVDLLRRLLARAATLTVRDENTRKFLAHYTDRDIAVIGDPALFLEPQSPANPEGGESAQPRIGINIPFHGHEPTEWIKKYLKEFVATLKKIQQATACEFTYFVHYDSEVLIAALIRDQGLCLSVVNTEATQLPDEYAKMDLHIGGMLHSCIIATAAGTPCIGLAYDEKHFGFFDLMERGEYCLKANPIRFDVLLQKSLQILQNETLERTKINTRRQELFVKFLRTLHGIAS